MNDHRKKACFTSHMGPWAIKPDVLEAGLRHVQAGNDITVEVDDKPFAEDEVAEGVAVLNLDGPAMKLKSKYGGYSSNEVAQTFRKLAARRDVHSILAVIDSPGGQVAGSFQCADAIYEARQKKRVVFHATNLIASAGFLLGAQADELTIDESGLAGCMGVFMVLHDLSKLAEAEGVKPILLSTGGVKGKPVPGMEVDAETIAEYQTMIDGYGELFVAKVARGRGIPEARAREWMTGQCWPAKKALEMGVVDGVTSVQRVLRNMQRGAPATAL